jgi:TctA family transporter
MNIGINAVINAHMPYVNKKPPAAAATGDTLVYAYQQQDQDQEENKNPRPATETSADSNSCTHLISSFVNGIPSLPYYAALLVEVPKTKITPGPLSAASSVPPN